MDTSKIYNIVNSELDPSFKNRSKVIIETLIRHKPKRILDAGCGRGYYITLASMLDFPVEIVGIDVSTKYLNLAHANTHHDKRVTIKQSPIESIPYPENYFDFIICSEVLEHVEDDKSTLKELHRVLKKGGTLVITVPNKNFPLLWDPLNWSLMKFGNRHVDKNIWWLAGMWADHERLYTLISARKVISSQFNITKAYELTRWGWPFTHFILYGIGKNIVEKGVLSSFNRFNFNERGIITQFLSKLISLPSTVLDPLTKKGSAVNIIIEVEK